MARIARQATCPVCYNYGGDPEEGSCPKCLKPCPAGIHRYNENYYDSCPYCDALLERVHES